MSIFQHVQSDLCLKMGNAGHSYDGRPVIFEKCDNIMGFTEPIDALDNIYNGEYQIKDNNENSCIKPEHVNFQSSSNAIMGNCDENSYFRILKEKDNNNQPELKEIDIFLMYNDNESALVNGNTKPEGRAMEYPLAHTYGEVVGALKYENFVIGRSSKLKKQKDYYYKECPSYIMSGEYFIGKDEHGDIYQDTFQIFVHQASNNLSTKKLMTIKRLDYFGGSWKMNLTVKFPIRSYQNNIKYNFIGCYEDRPTRALKNYHGTPAYQNEAIQTCAKKANDKNDKYFSLQNPNGSGGRPQCFSDSNKYDATKYGIKNCNKLGTSWGNGLHVLYPKVESKVNTVGYFTLYDIEESITENELFLNDIKIHCKIKYNVESYNEDDVLLGKSTYYLIRNNDNKNPKLFFTPMEPKSKKKERFIIDATYNGISKRTNGTYDNTLGREGHSKWNLNQIEIKTKDGFKANVNTDIEPNGLALIQNSSTKLRMIPKSSINNFKFMYHYPTTNKSKVNISSFLNPLKKIVLHGKKLMSRDVIRDGNNDHAYTFSFKPRQESFKEGYSIDQDVFRPVYSMGNVGDWPWGACHGFKDQKAEWIWHNKGLNSPKDDSSIILYTYENMTGKMIEARINVIVDNECDIFVNGNIVGKGRGGWGKSGKISQSFQLQTGSNHIFFDVKNFGGPAGLLATCYKTKDDMILFSTNSSRKWKSITINK